MADCWTNSSSIIQGISKKVAIPLLFVNIVSCIVGLLGNALVITTIVKETKFHNAQYLLIANLALSDFLICLLCFPLVCVSLTSPLFLLTEPFLCYAGAAMHQLVCPASIMTLVVIAISRYILVTKSRTRYMSIFSVRKVARIVAIMWVGLITYGVFYCVFVIHTTPFCDKLICYVEVYEPITKILYSFLNSVSLFVCLITVPVCYVLTFRVVRKSRARVHEQPPGNSSFVPTISGISMTQTLRISDGTDLPRTPVNQVRRSFRFSVAEIRLTQISSIIFFSNFILTMPFMVINVFFPATSNWIWVQVAFNLFAMNSAFNPILYGVLNKNLRKSMSRFLFKTHH